MAKPHDIRNDPRTRQSVDEVMSLIIVFHNDGTGTDDVGNYNVTVYVNQRVIDITRVEGHERKDNWRKLVRKLTEKQ